MFRGSSGTNLDSDRSCNKVSVGEITLVRMPLRWQLHQQQLKEEAEKAKAKKDDERETMSPSTAMHIWLARMDEVEAIIYHAPAQQVTPPESSSDGEICDLDGTDFESFEHSSYSRGAALATMLMDKESDQHHIKPCPKPTMSPEISARERRQKTFMQSIPTPSKGRKISIQFKPFSKRSNKTTRSR